MVSLHGAVDDDPVTVQNPGISHRVTLNIAIERCLWVTDVVAVEVERLMPIVISW